MKITTIQITLETDDDIDPYNLANAVDVAVSSLELGNGEQLFDCATNVQIVGVLEGA